MALLSYRNVLIFLFAMVLCASCQQSTDSNSSRDSAPTPQIQEISFPEGAADNSSCYSLSGDKKKIKISIQIVDHKVSGAMSIKSKTESSSGELKGVEKGEDVIVDYTFKKGDDVYTEKMLLGIGSQSLALSRSGFIKKNRDRIEWNDGIATMDVIDQVTCK